MSATTGTITSTLLINPNVTEINGLTNSKYTIVDTVKGDFINATLKNITFKPSVNSSVFNGNYFENCTFENCVLDGTNNIAENLFLNTDTGGFSYDPNAVGPTPIYYPDTSDEVTSVNYTLTATFQNDIDTFSTPKLDTFTLLYTAFGLSSLDSRIFYNGSTLQVNFGSISVLFDVWEGTGPNGGNIYSVSLDDPDVGSVPSGARVEIVSPQNDIYYYDDFIVSQGYSSIAYQFVGGFDYGISYEQELLFFVEGSRAGSELAFKLLAPDDSEDPYRISFSNDYLSEGNFVLLADINDYSNYPTIDKNVSYFESNNLDNANLYVAYTPTTSRIISNVSGTTKNYYLDDSTAFWETTDISIESFDLTAITHIFNNDNGRPVIFRNCTFTKGLGNDGLLFRGFISMDPAIGQNFADNILFDRCTFEKITTDKSAFDDSSDPDALQSAAIVNMNFTKCTFNEVDIGNPNATVQGASLGYSNSLAFFFYNGDDLPSGIIKNILVYNCNFSDCIFKDPDQNLLTKDEIDFSMTMFEDCTLERSNNSDAEVGTACAGTFDGAYFSEDTISNFDFSGSSMKMINDINGNNPVIFDDATTLIRVGMRNIELCDYNDSAMTSNLSALINGESSDDLTVRDLIIKWQDYKASVDDSGGDQYQVTGLPVFPSTIPEVFVIEPIAVDPNTSTTAHFAFAGCSFYNSDALAGLNLSSNAFVTYAIYTNGEYIDYPDSVTMGNSDFSRATFNVLNQDNTGYITTTFFDKVTTYFESSTEYLCLVDLRYKPYSPDGITWIEPNPMAVIISNGFENTTLSYLASPTYQDIQVLGQNDNIEYTYMYNSDDNINVIEDYGSKYNGLSYLDADFTELTLPGALNSISPNFSHCNLQNANFNDATLYDIDVALNNPDFSYVIFNHTSFENVKSIAATLPDFASVFNENQSHYWYLTDTLPDDSEINNTYTATLLGPNLGYINTFNYQLYFDPEDTRLTYNSNRTLPITEPEKTTPINLSSSKFTNLTFNSANLTSSTFDSCIFKNVTFDSIDFVSTISINDTTFTLCDFGTDDSSINTISTQFYSGIFDECIFTSTIFNSTGDYLITGLLANSIFFKSTLSNCDFSDASFPENAIFGEEIIFYNTAIQDSVFYPTIPPPPANVIAISLRGKSSITNTDIRSCEFPSVCTSIIIYQSRLDTNTIFLNFDPQHTIVNGTYIQNDDVSIPVLEGSEIPIDSFYYVNMSDFRLIPAYTTNGNVQDNMTSEQLSNITTSLVSNRFNIIAMNCIIDGNIVSDLDYTNIYTIYRTSFNGANNMPSGTGYYQIKNIDTDYDVFWNCYFSNLVFRECSFGNRNNDSDISFGFTFVNRTSQEEVNFANDVSTFLGGQTLDSNDLIQNYFNAFDFQDSQTEIEAVLIKAINNSTISTYIYSTLFYNTTFNRVNFFNCNYNGMILKDSYITESNIITQQDQNDWVDPIANVDTIPDIFITRELTTVDNIVQFNEFEADTTTIENSNISTTLIDDTTYYSLVTTYDSATTDLIYTGNSYIPSLQPLFLSSAEGEQVGLGADPIMYDYLGNIFEIPCDERIYNILKENNGDSIINVKTKLDGKESFNKYFYIYHKGKEIIFDIDTYKLYKPTQFNQSQLNIVIDNFLLEDMEDINEKDIDYLKVERLDNDIVRIKFANKFIFRFWNGNKGFRIDRGIQGISQETHQGLILGLASGGTVETINGHEITGSV